jgi:NADH dehydrogenase
MKTFLILGGSGFVGRHVCEKLVALGHRVTVPTRRRERAKHLLPLPTAQVVETRSLDASALQRLVAGHDAVVNLVAILHGREHQFEEAHVALVQRLCTAMQAAQVQRLVHVSALGADEGGPSMYQRSKARGEAVIRESARESGLAFTLLRPSVIFGAGDKFLNTFASLQALAPVMPLAGAGTKFQPVWVEDVAQAIVTALVGPHAAGTVGQTIECVGPGTYTLADLVRYAGQAAGVPRPVLPLPMSVGKLQALFMEFLPGPTLMSRDNVDSLKADNVASGRLPGLAALGITPAALETVGPTYLGAAQGAARFDRFRAHARR